MCSSVVNTELIPAPSCKGRCVGVDMRRVLCGSKEEKKGNQFYLEIICNATFDVDINLGSLKKTDNFLNQNANLMVS